MHNIIYIADIFMQRCAFIRALMLSFIVPQNKSAAHLYEDVNLKDFLST